MESYYHIVVENGDKRFEIESTDREWVEKQKTDLAKSLGIFQPQAPTRSGSTGKHPKEAPASSERLSIAKMTINEFYRNYCTGLKSNTDKAVFFLYFLSQVENKKNVSTNEIRDLFVAVGIPKANNLNHADILSRAKKRALLNYIDNKWSLTITGEDFVVNKIQGTSAD